MHVDLGAWGVETGYWDAAGRWQEPGAETLEAVAAAMGAGPGCVRPPPAEEALWCVTAGRAEPLQSRCQLILEDGTELGPTSTLDADLPLGYHRLAPLDGGPVTRLVVSPRRCHLPADLRAWGWAVQLYAARSRASWGIGDLGDLARLCRWGEGHGAGLIAINPLHAAGPAHP
ncbi:MAG TPA: 4-alpha-glucanotransferase, partial [Acidimicrobiales bacterium]|nr:4-alpha-glucanotransferase [Acidimicrobiales bacterium]